MQSELNHDLITPTCVLRTGGGALRAGGDGFAPFVARGTAHVLVSIHQAARAAPQLRLRHRASGEREERALHERHAAFWVGDHAELLAFAWPRADDDAGQAGGGGDDDLFVHCHAPMPQDHVSWITRTH